MKKKLSIFAIMILVLSIFTVCLAGCNDTGRFSNEVYLVSFRENTLDQSFTLPIKVQKYTSAPDSTKYFKSKLSLTQIADNLKSSGNYEAIERSNYIIGKDITEKHLGYFVIERTDKIFDKNAYNYDCNYVANNFACQTIKDGVTSQKEILVPLHFIPSLIGEYVIENGKTYDCTAMIEEIIEFYQEYGIITYPLENEDMVIAGYENADYALFYDPYGRLDKTDFSDTIRTFFVAIENGKIAYVFDFQSIQN